MRCSIWFRERETDAGTCFADGPALSRNRAIVLVSTIAAILLANIFFWSHKSNIVYDARGYYELSKIVGANGLFRLSDDQHTMNPAFHSLFGLRTYGYPLFVALCALFTNHDKQAVQLVVFSMQLLIYLLTCHLAAGCLRSRASTRRYQNGLARSGRISATST